MRMATIKISHRFFAIPLEQVREFLSPKWPTKVPMAPEPVMGILNLRGDILTAYDLADRVGVTSNPLEEGPYYAVVLLSTGAAAIAVDLPGDVFDWDEGQLNPTPPALESAWPGGFKGVFDTPLGAVAWIDVENLLKAKDEEITR